MKKKSKEKVVKIIFFFCIFVAGIITSYFTEFKDNESLIDIEENLLENEEKVENVQNSIVSTTVQSKLSIHYIDVGQADAILITEGENSMLIDAGKNDTEDMLVEYIKEQNVTKFDYVIGTHVHEDHIGGMDKIISNFEVDNILFPKQTSTTKTYENFVKAVKQKNKKLYAPTSGEEFSLGEASFKILAPNASQYENANDYSIVIKLTYKNRTFLFMGDALKSSETEILNKGYDLKSDVLKIGHHGSKTSTSEEFLNSVSPEAVIISCGKDNDYGHPSKSTMNLLKSLKVPVYRTDESGTIILNTDGENISFNVKEGTYNYGK